MRASVSIAVCGPSSYPEMAENNLLLPSEVPMKKADECRGKQSAEEKMAEMIGRLKLTSEESDALEVADDVEEGLATSNCAIIGKVISQGILHIQTIMSALWVKTGQGSCLRWFTMDGG